MYTEFQSFCFRSILSRIVIRNSEPKEVVSALLLCPPLFIALLHLQNIDLIDLTGKTTWATSWLEKAAVAIRYTFSTW